MSINSVLRSCFWLAAALSVPIQAAKAQAGPGTPTPSPSPGPTSTPGAGAGTVGPTTPGRGTVDRTPNLPTQQDRSQQNPGIPRSIYVSGKVLLDDGTPPPEPVVIERVCSGSPIREGYTDSKGRFSFALGQNTSMMADASSGSFGDTRMGGGMGQGGQSAAIERSLVGCEVRASLPGFRSDFVSLNGRRSLDNPDVGVIILHRLAKTDGLPFSGTSVFAPKDAKKAYEKGREAIKKNRLDDAEASLQKAVDLYPKYAAAWFDLGTVYHRKEKLDDARRCYNASIAADPKFLNPYAQMTRMAAMSQNWAQTLEYSDKFLKLNPYDAPEIYFYNSVANLNLKHLDAAEEHAREGLKQDPQHHVPRINQVLGVVLAQKQDFPAAAASMRTYLKLVPNAPDLDYVKRQVEEIERQTGAPAASSKPLEP